MSDMTFSVTFGDSDFIGLELGDSDGLGAAFGSSIKGDPGFSPVANVTRDGDEVIITITDESGTTQERIPVGDTGTDDHTELVNRDAADQHPESAITGLAADLAARPSEVITDADIWNL